MATFIDYAAIKEAVTYEQSISFLGLQMTKGTTELKDGRLVPQYRSKCPACRSNDDRNRQLAVTPDKPGFYCHSEKAGGDQIALVAHVRRVSMREAGRLLTEHFAIGKSQKPRSRIQEPQATEPPQTDNQQPQLDKIAARLAFDHPALEALGLPAYVCRALGIGFDPRTKRVMQPLYHERELVGFSGLATSPEQSPLMLFHKNLLDICTTKPDVEVPEPDNVVDFKKFYRA